MISRLIDKVNAANRKKTAPSFVVGDTVCVQVKIKEGDKERLQAFTGCVLARKGGGATETFTVRRVSHGIGVERVFPIHSPHVVSVKVETKGRVRRAKLYYLRERTGKQSRLREKDRR